MGYNSDKNHHIVVLANDRYFKVDTQGRSASQIAEAFQQIKKVAKSHKGSGLGILTVDDRDVWTEVSCRTVRRGDSNRLLS